MPSLRKKIYTLLAFFLLTLLLLICSLGYVMFKSSIHTDTRNMMIYQGLLIDESLAKGENDLPQEKLIGTYRKINKLPTYIQSGFQWSDMKNNVLYEQELLDAKNKTMYVYALIYNLKHTQGQLYIISEYQKDIEEKMHYEESLFYANFINIIIAAILLICCTLFLFILFYHSLLTPIRAVSEWLSKPTKEIPFDKIKYKELITVVQSHELSIKKQKELINKEEFFLRTISHELRTPIAIISSSTELLSRLNVNPQVVKVNERISYAINNMNYLIKTVLWLSRKNNQSLTQASINISKVINSVIKDNEYLILGRESQLSIKTTLDPTVEIIDNYGAVYLVLVNLIRNTLQHSADGNILIQHKNAHVTIQNTIENNAQTNNTESYGYGLYLVEKICASRNFSFSISYNDTFATTNVYFKPSVTD